MPIFIAALLGGLVQAAGTLVGRVLLSLGFGYVMFTGLDAGLSWVSSQIVSNVGQLGAQSIAVLGAAKVGSAVNIVLSAIGARLFLNGVTGGAIKKLMVR